MFTPTAAIVRPTGTVASIGPTATASAPMEIVDIRDNHFFPSKLSISVGTRVLRIDGGEMVHDVGWNKGAFRSTLTYRSRFSRTFRAARQQHVLLHTPRRRPHVRDDRRRIVRLSETECPADARCKLCPRSRFAFDALNQRPPSELRCW